MGYASRLAAPVRSTAGHLYDLPSATSTGTAVAFWFLVLLLSLAVAAGVVLVFRENPIPPGGDPGNWAATSFAYLGSPYPSQLTPLAYPPVVFPFLGASIAIAGNTINGVELFAGALVVALGLSTAALAVTILRSRAVAFFAVAFLLLDPAILAMFFWGAYPNLLGFVFANLAFVGLVRASRGQVSSGAAQFWGFFALTLLTHSLVGVVVAVTAGIFVTIGWLLSVPARRARLDLARSGRLESAAIAARALLGSRGGKAGMAVFALLVGGYYGFTYLAKIPHPYYFTSNPGAFRLTSMGAVFQAIVPNVYFAPSVALALLAAGILGLLMLVAVVRDVRPAWLTSSALLFIAWFLAVFLLLLGGYVAQVVTDYHRFGFALVIPFVLGSAYLVERAWVLRAPAVVEAPAPPTPGPSATATPAATPSPPPGATGKPATLPPPPPPPPPARRWIRRPDPWGRPAVFSIVAVAAAAILLSTATIPALARNETIFTKVGHDRNFLDAVAAIKHSGTTGGILTIPGADDWARGLSGENSFAPSASTAYLFYPSQELDSQLAYFGLETHFAVSNGFSVVSVHGTSTPYDDGAPAYSVYISGMPREMFRLAPSTISVTVDDPATGARTVEPLTAAPSVELPSAATGALVVSFAEPTFWLNLSSTVPTGRAAAAVSVLATARAPYELVDLSAAIVAPVGQRGEVWSSPAPGGFFWTDTAVGAEPVTYVNVTPAAALVGAASYAPTAGGPAGLLDFRAAATNGSPAIAGELSFATPLSSAILPGVSAVIAAPSAWSDLGVRFILMENETPSPSPNLLFVGEIPYLVGEYGLRILYANPEWDVLEIGSPAVATAPTVPV